MCGVIEKITSKYEVILASSSPSRYEIVSETMGLKDIKVVKPTFEEDLDKAQYENDPIRYVRDTSRGKAQSIVADADKLFNECNPKLIICADTIMFDNDKVIYEKPIERDVQLRNLSKFCYSAADNVINVVTAVTLIVFDGKNHKLKEFYELTKIFMDHDIPRELLEDYVESGDGLQVAGGFKIQGLSAMIIKKIEGDYYNVVGLPLNKTFQAMWEECK
ncbi:hypothetical protein KAFR_0J02050 [Kazachstania africana CBS 2517]|uniref:Maf-like protein n=1 Tax=Kazachstania africana (strain ATCC 22294 / BCRC 22015 / CBS 2517 / CECT 1963 / NBRC 1671 / NRRL Y-8276) TaxID=1071382 RepID=H2B0W9_KAZAF|nr:hypothetical protein KAFR_0J02050 [Kazachstania africana CBS 2517]CCF60269.1 hypothetical protein KAFR_0J02050 [Kazachstania africana CBS 2517]